MTATAVASTPYTIASAINAPPNRRPNGPLIRHEAKAPSAPSPAAYSHAILEPLVVENASIATTSASAVFAPSVLRA